MNNNISFHQVIECLKAHDIPYGVLTLQNDVSIIISQYGGRIFGPFLSPESESIASRIAMLHFEHYEDVEQLSDHLQGRREEIQCVVLEVDEDKIDAKFKRGVLKVKLPKTQAAQEQSRRIPIKTG